MKALCLVALAAVLGVLFGPGLAAADERVVFAPPMFQPAAPSASPTFAAPQFKTAANGCPNCTTCAGPYNCSCFGGGYYCADGSCPVQFNASQPAQFIQVCENGKCRLVPAPAQGGQFLPASGGCASGNCGVSSYPAGGCPSGSCGPTGGYSFGAAGSCASGSCGAPAGRRGLFGGRGLFGRRCR